LRKKKREEQHLPVRPKLPRPTGFDIKSKKKATLGKSARERKQQERKNSGGRIELVDARKKIGETGPPKPNNLEPNTNKY